MSDNKLPDENAAEISAVLTNDEGGLRAPPGLTGWRKAWWWFDFIVLVKLARLRFIAVLAAAEAQVDSLTYVPGIGLWRLVTRMFV